MTDRNYDYLPDDCDALKAEVVALERRVREMQAERGEAIAAAVKKEREEVASLIEEWHADPWNSHASWEWCDCDDLATAIRSRP